MRVETRRLRLRDISLLELNARFMRHETYQNLVENLKRDKVLTSTPFCAIKGYYAEGDSYEEIDTFDEEGNPITLPRYEVLSGNHRVQAAIDAGIEYGDCLVSDDPVPHDRRVAIQLSHNSIAGEDDPDKLKALYQSIEDVDMRFYSGLDDKALALLSDPKVAPLSEANLKFQPVSLLFLPDDLELAKAVFEDAKKASAKTIFATRFAEYDRWLDAQEETSGAYHVFNVATTLQLILAIFENHREDLQAGFLNEAGEAKHKGFVPLSAIFGRADVPAGSAAIIKRAVTKMRSEGDVTDKNLWKAVELWAADYLAGE